MLYKHNDIMHIAVGIMCVCCCVTTPDGAASCLGQDTFKVKILNLKSPYFFINK